MYSIKFNNLIKDLLSNRGRFVLWLPVLFGIGICIFFAVPHTLPLLYSFILCVVLIAVTKISSKKSSIAFYALIAITISMAGFLTAQVKTNISDSPIIAEDLGTVWVRATVEKIEIRPHGKRVYFKELDLWKPPPIEKFALEKTPLRMRLNIRTKMDGVRPGDRVGFKAILSPPPPNPVYPDTYNFAQFAYYEQIGAVGFSISELKVRTPSEERFTGFNPRVEALRHTIINNILAKGKADNMQSANVATALLTGERGGIEEDVIENMRKAGLGHLMAISGLHMALVMTTIFFVIRALMALIPAIALKYNIKKIAAIIALIVGLFYLLITGMPVSAKRAYIMISLFFLAILVDRTGTPMRPVAMAALIIMFFSPQALLTPGFQMSFAAVISLIAFYEYYSSIRKRNYMGKDSKKIILMRKSFRYLTGLIMSSLIAGMAISPFAIYYFGRFANYGLLANMLAIPLTSLWIMPWGVLALALMPLGLEGLALTPMFYGIEFLIQYSAYISNIPNSNTLVEQTSSLSIAFVALGGLWLTFWTSKSRLLGIIPLSIGLLLTFFPPSGPDIVIDGKGKLFAIRTANGKLAFSNTRSGFKTDIWMRINAQEEILKINEVTDITCENKNCTYNAKNRKIVFIKNTENHETLCQSADIIINLTSEPLNCNKAPIIDLKKLAERGTHAIWLTDDKIKIKTVL